jgi:hypothetical protein
MQDVIIFYNYCKWLSAKGRIGMASGDISPWKIRSSEDMGEG